MLFTDTRLVESTRKFPADFAIFTAQTDTFERPLDDTHGSLGLLNCSVHFVEAPDSMELHFSKAAIMKQIS